MEVISSRDMQILDTNCEYYGLSRLQLMENAGKALADEIVKRFESGKVLIFAGSGNNGGDGFVAARHLKNFHVEVYLMGQPKTEIARRNFEICCTSEIPVRDGLPGEIVADVIIDAMLGTGVRGKLREPYASAVEMINHSDAFTVAVDVPTGLNPDTGEYSEAVRADMTVTFHKAKPGLLKAREVCGEIVIKDIGIPERFERLCGPGDVQSSYRRREDAHKGEHGRVLVVGGGDYTGAPALTSLAAYYSGADIVTTVVPETIKPIVAAYSPNLIVKGTKGDVITLKNLKEVEKLIGKHDVVVAGMGVGDNDEFGAFVVEMLKSCKKAVLDAQGIVRDIPETCECILTPHKGEFRKVFGEPEPDNVVRVAERIESVILLKGKEDLITNGEKVKVNYSGNAGMTVGGTGDVLAGVCGALLCSDDAFHAACAAAFVNGYAGDKCFDRFGYNYTAVDLIKALPEAFSRCVEF
ncbi:MULTISPECIES: NAD(P)H-hydrate dehydratase [unclassified Archaeoglobus]|jgi:NAD(P)H-hydrate epimerase|uniref:NAD(P)H-hydrate dehydratase n=1 Tax=unclassified Archaeoglobus TaxID=2643606 RepID=UPI0025BA2E21|nr:MULTISPECIES: NAD(P)H-hydrate dehydratase [unclassified Archaeoglobus]